MMKFITSITPLILVACNFAAAAPATPHGADIIQIMFSACEEPNYQSCLPRTLATPGQCKPFNLQPIIVRSFTASLPAHSCTLYNGPDCGGPSITLPSPQPNLSHVVNASSFTCNV